MVMSNDPIITTLHDDESEPGWPRRWSAELVESDTHYGRIAEPHHVSLGNRDRVSASRQALEIFTNCFGARIELRTCRPMQ